MSVFRLSSTFSCVLITHIGTSQLKFLHLHSFYAFMKPRHISGGGGGAAEAAAEEEVEEEIEEEAPSGGGGLFGAEDGGGDY